MSYPEGATTYAYSPGDVLHFRDNDTTYVVNTKGYLYQSRTKAGCGLPRQRVLELNGPMTVNGEPYDPPNPLDEAATGALAHSDTTDRTYVRLPDGWVLATVGSNTSIRGTLKGGATGARLYATDELYSDTKLVK